MVPKCHPKIVAVNTETNNSPMFRNTHMDALLKNCIEELNQDFQVELSRTAFLCSLLLTYVVAVPSLPISNVQYPTDQLNLIPFFQPRSFSPSLTWDFAGNQGFPNSTAHFIPLPCKSSDFAAPSVIGIAQWNRLTSFGKSRTRYPIHRSLRSKIGFLCCNQRGRRWVISFKPPLLKNLVYHGISWYYPQKLLMLPHHFRTFAIFYGCWMVHLGRQIQGANVRRADTTPGIRPSSLGQWIWNTLW